MLHVSFKEDLGEQKRRDEVLVELGNQLPIGRVQESCSCDEVLIANEVAERIALTEYLLELFPKLSDVFGLTEMELVKVVVFMVPFDHSVQHFLPEQERLKETTNALLIFDGLLNDVPSHRVFSIQGENPVLLSFHILFDQSELRENKSLQDFPNESEDLNRGHYSEGLDNGLGFVFQAKLHYNILLLDSFLRINNP